MNHFNYYFFLFDIIIIIIIITVYFKSISYAVLRHIYCINSNEGGPLLKYFRLDR